MNTTLTTLGNMKTNRPILAIAISALLFLSACATITSKTSRVHLGGKSFLELGIPAGWELRVAYGPQGTVEQVRVFREAIEVMQIVPVHWSGQRSQTGANQVQSRNAAVLTLQERSRCKDFSLEERALPQGVAAYCPTNVNDARIVGVWSNGEITTEFSFLDHRDSLNSELWRVLGSIKRFDLADAA